MPVQTMQSVAEHQLFKAATPLVAAALIGCITWLFMTVMSVEKELHLFENRAELIMGDFIHGQTV